MENRSFLYSKLVKFLLFVLIIVSFTTMGMFFLEMANNRYDIISPFGREYKNSEEAHFKYSNLYYDLSQVLNYKNGENIEEISRLDKEEIFIRKERLFEDFVSRSEFQSEYSEVLNKDTRYDDSLTKEENIERFNKLYSKELEEIEEEVVRERLSNYEQIIKRLEKDYGLNSTNKKQDIYFYATDGENVYKNKNLNEKDMDEYISSSKDWPDLNRLEGTILIAMDNDYFRAEEERWTGVKNSFYNDTKKLTLSFIVTLVLLIGLIILTGRDYFGDKKVHLNVVDGLYTDINIWLCIALGGAWFSIVNMTNFAKEINLVMMVVTAFLGSLGLLLVLSLVRHIKNKSFLRHSVFGKVFLVIINFFKKIYESGKSGHKFVFWMVVYPLALLVTILVFPITMAFFIFQGLKRVQDFESIKEGVRKVKDGDLDYKIQVDSSGEMKDLADNINSISDGLKNAVDNELKSERLKSELITNVSHDIRTPLTSIITYVDLLKTETDVEKQQEYIEILEKKAERLKLLTDNLFEASKASSGNIPVDLKVVNLVALINQGIGELDDKINENQLSFITTDLDELNVLADGELLWRSLDNIFNNIFKYGQKGSRVYIDLLDEGDMAKIVIKNISEYELNISEDELMERFKRGDESRTSEGSGLGLSIVKSLIELQNGNFKIEIDGDLFKSIIEIPREK